MRKLQGAPHEVHGIVDSPVPLNEKEKENERKVRYLILDVAESLYTHTLIYKLKSTESRA